MLRRAFSRLTCAAVILSGFIPAAALAQPSDMRTFFTFSGPVAVPGATLPAGKYLFRIVDTTTGRTVVQVLSADGKTPHSMFLIWRASRPDVPSEPEVRFMETAAGMPQAVRTWWYPGNRTGYEFVYPKAQARLLARGSGQPVLATATEPTTIPAPPAVVERIEPSGEETAIAETAPPAFAPTGPILLGQLAPPTLDFTEPPQLRAELPRTASGLPLTGLAGLMLVLGALMIRGWRTTHC
jgi:hypothetical protein